MTQRPAIRISFPIDCNPERVAFIAERDAREAARWAQCNADIAARRERGRDRWADLR